MNTSNVMLSLPSNTPITKLAEVAEAFGYDLALPAEGPVFTVRAPEASGDPHLDALADCAFAAITDPHFMRNLVMGLLLSHRQEWRPLVLGLQRAVSSYAANNTAGASAAAFAIAKVLDRLAAETVSEQLHDQVLPAWLQDQAS